MSLKKSACAAQIMSLLRFTNVYIGEVHDKMGSGLVH